MQNLKMDNNDGEDALQLVPLGKLCLKLRGVSYSKGEATAFPAEDYLPILRANNIDDNELNYDGLVYVPKSRVATKQLLQKGDVVIAMSSGSKKLVGKGAQLKKDWNGSFGAFCGVLRPNLDMVNQDYFGYFFSSASYRNHISDVSAGTSINNLKNEHFENIIFPLPSLKKQRTIAAQIDNLLPDIKINKTRLKKAKKLVVKFRQAILYAAFSGKLTEDWRANNKTKSVDNLLERIGSLRQQAQGKRAKTPLAIADTDLPDIPETWRWVSVDTLSNIVVDGVHKKPNYIDNGVPFITVRNLTAGQGLSFEQCRYISESDHKAFTLRAKPERGDLLITKDGTLGVVRAIRTDREFSIFVSVAMIKPVLYEMSDYLELALSSPQVQSQMVGVGSGLVHLVLRDLKADGIPVPPLEEQKEIVKKVNQYLEVANQVEKQIEKAEKGVGKLTQAILAKTFKAE